MIAVLAAFICMPQMDVYGEDVSQVPGDGGTTTVPADSAEKTFTIVAGEHIKSVGIIDPETGKEMVDSQTGKPITTLKFVEAAEVNIKAVADDGYHFLKYDVNGTAPQMDITKAEQKIVVQDTVTLTAQAEANTYKIRYESNGGSGKMTDQSMTYDVWKSLKANAFTRAHYDFKGWNTKANGKGKAYRNKQKVKNLAAEQDDIVTLYAQWKKKPSYTISYSLNGGTLNSKTGTVKYSYETGTKITLPKPVRKGYTFDYWRGSKYKAGDKYTVKSDHTFTAVWKTDSNNNSNKKNSNNNSNNNNSNRKDKSAKTDDPHNQTIPILLMLISAAIMALALVGRKKSAKK